MSRKTISIILTLIVVLSMTAAIAPIRSVVLWDPETQLTTHPDWDAYPSIIQTPDGNVLVVFQSDRGGNWTFDIYYMMYNMYTGVWSLPTPITTSLSHEVTPFLMKTNNGTVWLFWSSTRTGDYDLFYKTSRNNGYTWSNATQLTTDPKRDLNPSAIQDTNGTIWVVWQSSRTGDYDLFYKTYNGSWSNATQLTTNVYNDELPSIAQMKDDRIWVVWQYATDIDFEIYYKTYNGSWSNATALTNNPDYDWDPSIIQAHDDSILMVWSRELYRGGTDPWQDDLFYKTSVDNGATWSEDIQLTTDEDWNENGPSVAEINFVGHCRIWLTWHSDKGENFDIYFSRTNLFIRRDVAITDVTTSSTAVHKGGTVSINVTVENQGDRRGHANEIFTVDCYVNTTLIGSENVSLGYKGSTVIVFSWNTSSFAYGTYVISANASAVPDELPVNLADNTYINGAVLVTMAGDIDGDGDVDMFDFGAFAQAYATSVGDENYNVACDFDGDGDVDMFDFNVFVGNYGDSL